jgi:hypothetical protein
MFIAKKVNQTRGQTTRTQVLSALKAESGDKKNSLDHPQGGGWRVD